MTTTMAFVVKDYLRHQFANLDVVEQMPGVKIGLVGQDLVKAADRAIFARGAVKAALWANGKPPGVYSMVVISEYASGRKIGSGVTVTWDGNQITDVTPLLSLMPLLWLNLQNNDSIPCGDLDTLESTLIMTQVIRPALCQA